MLIQMQLLCILHILCNYSLDFCKPPVGKYSSLEAMKQIFIGRVLYLQKLKLKVVIIGDYYFWLRLISSALCL